MLLVTGCDGAANKVVGYDQGHRVLACLSSCRHLSRLRIQVHHKIVCSADVTTSLVWQPDLIVVWFTQSNHRLMILFSSCFFEFPCSCEHSFLCAVLPFFLAVAIYPLLPILIFEVLFLFFKLL